MTIGIKQIILESWEEDIRDASYVHSPAKQDFEKSILAYDGLKNRGLSFDEKSQMINGLNNLTGGLYMPNPRNIEVMVKSSDDVINDYKNMDLYQKYDSMTNRNAMNSDMLRDTIDTRDMYVNEYNKTRDEKIQLKDKFHQYQDSHPLNRNQVNTQNLLAGTAGLGAGIYGNSLYNRLKNKPR